MALRAHGPTGPWPYGPMGPWPYGPIALWAHGPMAPRPSVIPKAKYMTLGPKFFCCSKMAITRRRKHLFQ